ncbi:hypothetical protein ABIB25_000050 [Nakamurella sp. UYEF19]|uniref:amino acid-binding ACT domain-containing protein n=1 Tax=Nakamurella sp. UYEF19 TaxID=1756392 RepID=UPI0033945A2C
MKGELRDICVHLPNRPGALAEFGETMGRASVSIEGGGVFAHAEIGIAHFLISDADTAAVTLFGAGLPVASISDVVRLRLDQGTPGQLGTLTRLMADAGVNIDTQYSDHDRNLVLVVPPHHLPAARQVAEAWSTRAFLLPSPGAQAVSDGAAPSVR